MRAIHFIWTFVSFILAIVTIIVILRFFGLTVDDITSSLASGFGFFGKLLKMLRDASL